MLSDTQQIFNADEVFGSVEEKPQASETRGDKVVLDSEIIPQSNYLKPFKFSVKWLNDYCKTIKAHAPSGYPQIEVKALQNIAYLFSYGGLRAEPFYILDLCPSGTGKGENVKLQSQLLLSPVYERQKVKLNEDIERYNAEVAERKGKDKELVKPPMLHKCIHSNDTSKEALFESFEAVPAQLIEFSELGLRLKQNDPTIDYICDGYGKSELTAPNYKNQRYKGLLKVDGTSLFFIGDTNLQYLTKKAFYNHLQGGLINRCLIVYDDYTPIYEEIPTTYTVSESDRQIYNEISEWIIDFAYQHMGAKINPSYHKSPILKEYEKILHNTKRRMSESRNINAHLYNRSIQNLRAIIEVLHLIKCHDLKAMIDTVSDDTIKEGIEFCKRYFNFDKLINELDGTTEDDVKKEIADKIRNKIYQVKLPCSLRQIYKSLKLDKKELKVALSEMGASFNDKEITFIP